MLNANSLRSLVLDNQFVSGRITAEQLGNKEDFVALTAKYRTCLDVITEWASADYAHKATPAHVDNAFTEVKAILSLFDNGEDHIIIDNSSLRTLRDCATKPRRLYSAEYTKARKEYNNALNTFNERINDLRKLGAVIDLSEAKDCLDIEEKLNALPIGTYTNGTVDMAEMAKAALTMLALKNGAVELIKKTTKWSWKRPVAVSTTEFAELLENYVADCLNDGYNLKPSKTVREEAAAAKKAAKEAKNA